MNCVKAIILAAGQGTRLKDLSKEIPKCMVTIGQKKIIDYQLDALITNNIKDVVIVVGHRKEKLISYIKNSNYNNNLNILFLENKLYKTTNSCYSLWIAKEHMRKGYIHLNSDLIFHPKLLTKLLNQDSSALIIDHTPKSDDDMVRGEIINGSISKMGLQIENPSCIIVGPIYFSEKGASEIINELDNEINDGNITNTCYVFFDKILNKVNCKPIFSNGLFWKEIDTLTDLESAKNTPNLFIN